MNAVSVWGFTVEKKGQKTVIVRCVCTESAAGSRAEVCEDWTQEKSHKTISTIPTRSVRTNGRFHRNDRQHEHGTTSPAAALIGRTSCIFLENDAVSWLIVNLSPATGLYMTENKRRIRQIRNKEDRGEKRREETTHAWWIMSKYRRWWAHEEFLRIFTSSYHKDCPITQR